jgi:phospholipid/cholesterol/gamma-HCH transport system substrate-binding protein
LLYFLFGGLLPSQHQLRWAQLRVGVTVIFASITLAVLIFLMSGNVGLFSHKLLLYAYFENAGGLRVGAPVRLEGVDIGNVTAIRLVPPDKQPAPKLTTPADQITGSPGERIDKPVQITMKIGRKYLYDLRSDSIALLSTAGVLGETFIDIDSTSTSGPVASDGTILRTRKMKSIEGMVSASQSTVENVDVLVRRLDRILSNVERGQGSLGMFLTDKSLYNNLNATVRELQTIASDMSNGRGTVGKLLASDELYNKLNGSVDKLNRIVDELNDGNGTVGRLIKDPTLYNNANQTIAKANKLMDDISSGRGAIGKFASDQEFARKLDATITSLQVIASRLQQGEGSAGLLLKDPSLYTSADQMLSETRGLIKAMRENPKRYLTNHLRIF